MICFMIKRRKSVFKSNYNSMRIKSEKIFRLKFPILLFSPLSITLWSVLFFFIKCTSHCVLHRTLKGSYFLYSCFICFTALLFFFFTHCALCILLKYMQKDYLNAMKPKYSFSFFFFNTDLHVRLIAR